MDALLPLIAPLSIVVAFVAAIARSQYQITAMVRQLEEHERWNREYEKRLDALEARVMKLEWEQNHRPLRR